MALAVTHVIVTIVVLDLFRHYVWKKKGFPKYLLIIGGIAGLLPDIDIPLSWVYNFLTGASADFHGAFTHSLFFPLVFLGMGMILYRSQKKEWAKILFVISFGWFFHLFLDCLYGGYKTFFWPLIFTTNFCPKWGIHDYAASIDAIILVLWLVHEEINKRIKDYI